MQISNKLQISNTLQIPNKEYDEAGFSEYALVMIPIIFLFISALSVFQYGIQVNTLTNDSILIGRELARIPKFANEEVLTAQIIENHNLEIDDFHIMRYKIGNREFLQTTLIGRTLSFGIFNIRAAGKSTTLVDR